MECNYPYRKAYWSDFPFQHANISGEFEYIDQQESNISGQDYLTPGSADLNLSYRYAKGRQAVSKPSQKEIAYHLR